MAIFSWLKHILTAISIAWAYLKGKRAGRIELLDEQIGRAEDAIKIEADVSGMSEDDLDKWMRKHGFRRRV